MSNSMSVRTLWICSCVLVLCTSCGSRQSADKSPSPTASNSKAWSTDTGNAVWIPLDSAADAMGLRIKDTSNTTQLGYTDAMYEIHEGQHRARSKGLSLKLRHVPVRQGNRIYITQEDLSTLLGTPTSWDKNTQKVQIQPFSSQEAQLLTPNANDTPLRSLSAVDKEALIAFAKRFLGVRYEFGSSPYEQSKTFDCSSFTQYVFKKYDIDLPRLASQQAELGTAVTRSELQTGDLIFFTVPGRFKDDKIPGHVGIYIGDGKFIHTWGDPGVQISDLDKGYWKGVILSMRRVL
ncbi:cell wall-associated NlpC family hydrolase [Paenibacillus shirakamiensis]|uniref:Cell wall-associated NlpC family hydrolase n=1 Tax=Paenibacillus shirakamiensis TaxID=1265935 RepID=A0ABS4JHL7_9BACL|nr:C40 family peptidase [Paenibacillus shirakamiensis]MBP2001215.1 cell wall-associated NlpC family hydrolase [Paenibacillus shirakamiensis]